MTNTVDLGSVGTTEPSDQPNPTVTVNGIQYVGVTADQMPASVIFDLASIAETQSIGPILSGLRRILVPEHAAHFIACASGEQQPVITFSDLTATLEKFLAYYMAGIDGPQARPTPAASPSLVGLPNTGTNSTDSSSVTATPAVSAWSAFPAPSTQPS